MVDNSPQQLAEFRVMKNVISGERNPFNTEQDRTMVAYRNQVKKVNNNFPIRF